MMSSSNPSPSSKEMNIFENNQHAINISGKLLKFYEEERFLDTVILAGEDCIKIQAHEIVLSAFSDYFLDTFHANQATSKINEVQIREVEGSALKSIVDFMYSGSIQLNMEQIEILLRGAVFLKIKKLVDGCCDFLEKNLNSNNCLHWLLLADELSLSGVKEKSLKLIYTHLGQVTETSKFSLLNEIQLKDLLFKSNTYGDLEEQVFLSLVAWIESDKVNREHLLLELLSMIRYHFLTPKFIIENIKPICLTFEYCELILNWLRFHLSPELRTTEEQQLTLGSKQSIKADLNQEVPKFSVVHLNENCEAEIRSYNQTLKTWSLDKRLPPFSSGRGNYTFIVIGEKLFIAGLSINSIITKGVECLDLRTIKKSILPQMRIARFDSQLANVNGHLCVFGGFDNDEHKNFIDSVEIFDFSTEKWTNLHPLIKPNKQQKIVGHNGILYIFDFHYGCLQCFDISTNQWTSKKLPIDDSVGEFRIAAIDNFVYAIIGGEYDQICQWVTFKKLTFKRYDLSNETWCDVGVLRNDGGYGNMVTIIGNKIMFVNGNFHIAEYNLETKKITKIKASATYYCCAYIFPFKF